MKIEIRRYNRHFPLVLYVAFLFLTISIQSCANNMHIFYVSSSIGNDSNPGSKELPKRTIGSITSNYKRDVEIRLKRGDVFFENLSRLENYIIDAYGTGEKPILCGFKVLKDSTAWFPVGDSIWKLKMTTTAHFIGFPDSLATDIRELNDVGCVYDIKRNRIYGHLVPTYDSLKKEGDFFTSSTFKKDEITPSTFEYLYFKFDENPQKLGNLAFPVFENGVFYMRKCIIRNIAIIGFGKCGMANLADCKIENCLLDVIGGSIQLGYQNYVRFGNGIELYDTSYNDSIVNCTISRTYDSGVTIQALGKIKKNPTNITFSRNTFYHCRQAFEHFMNPSETNYNPKYIRCEFVNNICYEMGNNEFNTPQMRDANILSHEKSERELKIENNIFYGAPHYCGHVFAKGMKKNKVFIYRGQYLNHFHAIRDYPTIYANHESDITVYKKRTGDESDIVILDKGSKRDKRISKRVKMLIERKMSTLFKKSFYENIVN